MKQAGLLRLLVRNEWTKTWKRPAFHVTLGLVLLMDGLGFGWSLRQSLRADGDFALPGAWTGILGSSSHTPMLFGGIVVILLVANEFSWRTVRQNVIDGLSRSEWYLGKTIIAALVVMFFCAAHVGLGGTLAWIGTPPDATRLVAWAHAAALGGVLLSGVGYAIVALFFASLLRRPGGAMAAWLFYVILAERLIYAGLARYSAAAERYASFLPIRTFDDAREYLVFATSSPGAPANRRAAMGISTASPGDPGPVLAAAVWIVGLTIVGLLIFRRRDL